MAATAVTTTMAGAINYTYVTDTSADWASVPNSTYFYDKADKLVHYKNGTGAVLEIFGAGGLTYFTEAQNTSAPNATVPVDSLTAVSAATNADVAILPKGDGAILRQIPDGTATSGNKRGTRAVDLQAKRNVASQVASGNDSFCAGRDNTASNDGSVAIGQSNTSNSISSVAIGSGNIASQESTAIGKNNNSNIQFAHALGEANTINGNYGFAFGYLNKSGASGSIALGSNNEAGTAYNNYSIVAIGSYAKSFDINGRHVYSNGQVGVSGDCQYSKFILKIRTTDATATTVTTNNSSATAANQVILSNQSAYRFKGSIVGKQSGSVNAAVWDIDGFIVRGANAAATTLNISNVTLVQNTPAWGTPTLAADTTNGGLRVQVIGAVGTNIQWTVLIETTEVIYA